MTARLALLCGVLLVLLAGRGAAAERTDYCALPGAQTVLFLVDRSDAYDAIDRDELAAGAERVFEALRPGDRLVLHTVTGDFTTTRRLFDDCLPGCPEQSFFDSLLGKCRASSARRDLLEFRNRFAATMLGLLQQPEQHPASAILETIAALGRQYAAPAPARLVIYSDLIEHSRLGDFLKTKGLAGFLERARAEALIPRLDGTEVHVFGFGRTHGTNRRGLTPERKNAIERFWRDYFAAAGAAAVTITQQLES